MSAGVLAECHCGRARIRSTVTPAYINQCNCSLCEKSGFRGIYFRFDELTIEGEFDDYVRTDLTSPMIRVFRCQTCGCPTHWLPLGAPPYLRVGVNARLVEPALLDGIEIINVDGRSWDG